ncbi:uncharacterized protein [Nicotiana sylvestris]|uniref:uncharacterized protein n=1 Tax=Nicotiana sylvestris TaxID=4096 RepID=UPI00388C7668
MIRISQLTKHILKLRSNSSAQELEYCNLTDDDNRPPLLGSSTFSSFQSYFQKMRSKVPTSKSKMMVVGKGVKFDYAKEGLALKPSFEANVNVQAPDDDDFESPSPPKNSQQESSRITRSLTRNSSTPVKSSRDLPSTHASEVNKHVQAPDNDDFESPVPTKKLQQESSRMTRSQTCPNVKPKRRKINDDGESGLNCISKEQRRRHHTFCDKPDVNRLLKEYFPEDGKKAITRGQLLDRFQKKDWKSDEDAFKMALMVFVHHFIFSYANNHGINKDDFDIIESSQYQTLGGLPLALQIWFFECCSMIDKYLAVRIGTNVPRILNWKVTETPTYADLTGGVIMCSIDKLNYRNISPTREEMSTLNIDTLFEVNVDDVASGEVHVESAFHTDDSVVVSPPFPQNMFTNTVTTLSNDVVSSFEKMFSFLNMKETKQTREDVTDSKIPQRVSDDNTSGLGEFDGYQYDVVPNFVNQVNQDNVLADEGVTNLAACDVKGDTFWDDIGDKDLVALHMSQIVLYKQTIINVEDDYISTEQSVRQKILGKYAKYPYLPIFDSRASGSAHKLIFYIKHPFTIEIDDFDPLSPLAKEFRAFVDNGMDTRRSAKNIYPDEVNKLAEDFTFGSCHVTTKDWFHSLAYCGRPLIDTHLNVLFYYLRKRGKYGPSVAMRFTTTDFGFDNKINSLYKNFKVNQDLSVIPEGHEIEKYIRGYYCDANVPWHTIDHVLFPIYMKRGRTKLGHWVLGLFKFIDRCIHIYDSNRGAINDRLALDVELPYAILIPYFLKSSDFYVVKKGIDCNNGAYTDKSHSDALQINLVNNVLQQIKCYSDCGAFVAGFAECFILGKEIRKDNFDIETLCTRWGSLLWDYGRKKQQFGAISGNEITGRLFRKRKRGRPRK